MSSGDEHGNRSRQDSRTRATAQPAAARKRKHGGFSPVFGRRDRTLEGRARKARLDALGLGRCTCSSRLAHVGDAPGLSVDGGRRLLGIHLSFTIGWRWYRTALCCVPKPEYREIRARQVLHSLRETWKSPGDISAGGTKIRPPRGLALGNPRGLVASVLKDRNYSALCNGMRPCACVPLYQYIADSEFRRHDCVWPQGQADSLLYQDLNIRRVLADSDCSHCRHGGSGKLANLS